MCGIGLEIEGMSGEVVLLRELGGRGCVDEKV